MIFADHDRDGTVRIEFNSQADQLLAPSAAGAVYPFTEPRKWLPCEMCGGLQAVAMNVVSFTCDGCERDLADEDHETDLVYEGRVQCDNAEGGCGTVSRAFHDDQFDDPRSWVHASRKRWLRAGLRVARLMDERVAQGHHERTTRR